MLLQDELAQFFILLGEQDVILEQFQHARNVKEAFDFGLQLPHLLMLPVKEIAAHRVPGRAIVKAKRIGSGKGHFGDEQFRCLDVVAANLVNAQGDAFVFICILTFHHQHRDAVDEKDHIFAVAIAPVVPGELFGHFIDIALGILIVNQHQIEFAVFGGVKELASIAQVGEHLPVALDVGR